MEFYLIIEKESFLTHHSYIGTKESCLKHEEEYLEDNDNYYKNIEYTLIPIKTIVNQYRRSKIKKLYNGELLNPTNYILNNF